MSHGSSTPSSLITGPAPDGDSVRNTVTVDKTGSGSPQHVADLEVRKVLSEINESLQVIRQLLMSIVN